MTFEQQLEEACQQIACGKRCFMDYEVGTNNWRVSYWSCRRRGEIASFTIPRVGGPNNIELRRELEKRGWFVFIDPQDWANFCDHFDSLRAATLDELDSVGELYDRDKVMVDDDALCNDSEDGTWMQAWVRLTKSDCKELGDD